VLLNGGLDLAVHILERAGLEEHAASGERDAELEDVSGFSNIVEAAFSGRDASCDETLFDEAIFLDLDSVGLDRVFQFAKISHD